MKFIFDWDKIPERFNFAAVDKSGDVFAFETKPEVHNDSFWDTAEETQLFPIEIDWKNSLEERPKKQNNPDKA